MARGGQPKKNGKSSKAAADVPVPSEHGNESGFGGEEQAADPWKDWKDPWASRAADVTPEPPVMQPSLDGYLQFCTWWQTAVNSESGEKSFSVGDSGNGNWYQESPVDGQTGGKGCRHRQSESRDPGKPAAGGQDYERDQPRRRPNVARSDPGVRRGGDRGGPDDPSEPGDGYSNGGKGGGKPPPKKGRLPPGPPGGGPGDPDEPEGSEWTDPESSARTSEIRELLQKKWKNQQDRPKSSLGSVRIEDFAGERSKYRGWRRVVKAQQELYRLETTELSMLIYFSCKKEARDVLDQLTIDEMVAPGGLGLIWQLLDEAYHETSEEYFERVESEFSQYRRVPQQSIASYLSQIKRLRADYHREDPGTVFSDRAWAQRLLVRASLTKRERLDVFFSAGGVYEPKAIERALRHRCQRVHEEERRVPTLFRKGPRSFSSKASTTTSGTSSTSTTARSKFSRGHGAHVAGMDVVEEEGENAELEDQEDLEQDPEAYEAYAAMAEKEEGEEEDELESEGDESVSPEELREAWAAGWRAKDRVAEKKKGRNFRQDPKNSRKDDPRKKSTTCSSCGNVGHWKGDPECPKVKSGEDKLFQPKPKKNGVHLVMDGKEQVKPTHIGKDVKVHEINFSFVASHTSLSRAKAKSGPVHQCSQCGQGVKPDDRFCAGCGGSLAVMRMTDQEKRRAATVEVASSDSEGFTKVDADEPEVPENHRIPVSTVALKRAVGVEVKESDKNKYKYVSAEEASLAIPYVDKDERRKIKALLLTMDVRERFAHEDRGVGSNQMPVIPRRENPPAPGRVLTTLDPTAAEKPTAVKARELEEFRRRLYDERVSKSGKLRPSEGSPLPNQEQKECPHPWNRLRWSANQHGHFARCRACDLKNVLCWHERHGSFVAEEQEEFQQEYLPQSGTLAIGDSGCKTAVGGVQWHERFQRALKEKGLSWKTIKESEVFKFGAGDPVRSQVAHIYPVGLHGFNSFLRMSVVADDAADCPGLVGPADMSRWKVSFNFGSKTITAMGVTRPMTLTATRHPGLDLLQFGSKPSFDSSPMKMLSEQLEHDPYAFAFVTALDGQEGGSSEDSGNDGQLSVAEFSESSDGDGRDEQTWELIQDMENHQHPMIRQTQDCQLDLPGQSDAGSLTDCSTTSHEFGVLWDEDSSSEEEEVDVRGSPSDHEVLWSRVGKMCTMTKGKRRQFRSKVRDMTEVFTVKRTEIPRAPRLPTPQRPCRPYKVMEIFTWTLAITMVAVQQGWTGCEPVTLPRWDLRSLGDRVKAFEYVQKESPDLLVVAWPCTVWSPLQFLGTMTAERHERLLLRQQEDRDTFLNFVHEVVNYQKSVGRAVLGENPWTSRAWKEVPIKAAFDGMGYGRCDMCRFGLAHPTSKKKLMKPTCLAGTEEIVQRCSQRCQCVEPHDHTLGSYRDRFGTHSVAEFAGGYTRRFAKQVIQGAEEFLDNWSPDVIYTFPSGAGLPEERFMDMDDEVPGEGSEFEDEPSYAPTTVGEDVEDDLEKEYEKDAQEQVPPDPADHDDQRIPQGRQEPRQLQEEDYETLKQLSAEKVSIHEAVEKIHRRLGHPSTEALVRTLKIGGAPKETLDYAKKFRCSTCQSMAPPERPFQQAARARPAGFNVEVHVDLKYAKNVKGENFVALSMVCAGTNKHAAVLLKTRQPAYVAKKFIKHWIAPFGRPSRIVMDQGGEFEREWILMLEQFGIQSKTTGSHAGWQHALAERHGGLLGITWHALVVQYSIVEKGDMAVALAAAIEAKNEVMTRRGYSPNMMVFGKNVTYPELLGEEDVDPITLAQNLDVDCEMAKRSKMRQEARMTLLRDDVQEKLKKALVRKPTTQERVFVPGELIYFFVPHPSKPRYRKDHGRWRGPAVVIMQESHQKYFCSWRGRCLLLAAANMRAATAEEAMAKEMVIQEMQKQTDGNGEDDAKQYEDLSQMEQAPPSQQVLPPSSASEPSGARQQPPEVRERPRPRPRTKRVQTEATRMMCGLKSVKKLLERSSLLRNKRHLGISDAPVPRRRRMRMKAIKDGSVGHGDLPQEDARSVPMVQQPSHSDHDEAEADEVVDEEAFWRACQEDEERVDEDRRQWDTMSQEERRQSILQDLPACLKRRHEDGDEEDQLQKRLKRDFYMTVMLAVSQKDLPRNKRKDERNPANEWVGRTELKMLRRLLDLPIVSARWHHEPRKRMQKPPNDKGRKRISVLLGEQPGVALLVQENETEVKAHPRRRAPFSWRGMTLFVRGGVKDETSTTNTKSEVFVQNGEVMYRVHWPVDKLDVWKSFIQKEERDRQACETFLLRMKASGKELDPKCFEEAEWAKFRESDRAEWLSWIKNEVVQVVPKDEEKHVSRDKVFRIPLRWVRTNKSKELDAASNLMAKSRLVVPGHADPDLGDFRTDAPTTNPVAVRLLKMLAVTRNWTVMVFDVSTAFLSGNPTSRLVYVKAPSDGLPATSLSKEIAPYALLRVLKSAYGLSEAPRLWYLRAAQLLEECGLVELPYARATFVQAAHGKTQAVCTLHVDDGMLAGDPKSPGFQRLLRAINERFNIKEWKTIGKEPCDFLGCKVSRSPTGIVDCMSGYVAGIQPMVVEKGEAALNEKQRTAFRRLVMQLRWPAQHVFPEKLYVISELAQSVTRATMAEARGANKVLTEFQECAGQGQMKLTYRALTGEPYVISFFDASLGKSGSARAQRGQVHFVATKRALVCPDVASIAEFHSSRITRVVKSSLAAEGNALSSAVDAQLFLRLLLEALWYGPVKVTANWMDNLKFHGTAVTDAKALYDHLVKTGHMTSERQTALDILAAKQLIEAGVVAISWVPTFRQFADCLTKDMLDLLFCKFKKDGSLCLKETAEDAKTEAHRSALRRAQRERRKIRMQAVQ